MTAKAAVELFQSADLFAAVAGVEEAMAEAEGATGALDAFLLQNRHLDVSDADVAELLVVRSPSASSVTAHSAHRTGFRPSTSRGKP